MSVKDLVTDSTTFGVFISLMVATVLPGLALVALTLRRRRTFPLCGRDMSLVIAQSLGLLGSALFTGMRGITPLPCGVGLLNEIAFPVWGTTIAMFRLWRLWFLFHFAQEKLDKHRRKHEPTNAKREKHSTWYTDHRHWISPSFMWKRILTTVFVTSLIASLIYGLSKDLDKGTLENEGCPRLDRAYTVSLVFQGACLVSVLALSYKIRKVRDGFFIKEELKIFAVILVFTVVANNLVESALASVPFPVFRLYKSICFIGFVGAILLYPMWHSYAHERANEKAVSNIKALFNVTLVSLLTDDAYAEDRADFEKMLIKEFSVENMMFFEAARRFEALVPDQDSRSDDCVKDLNISEGSTDEYDRDRDTELEPDEIEACPIPESPKSRTSPPMYREQRSSIVAPNFVESDEEHRGDAMEAESKHVSIEQHAFCALVLYAQFIRKGSPYEVNIIFQKFKAIEEEILGKVNSNFVDEFCAAGGTMKFTTDFTVSAPIRTDVFSQAKAEVLLLLEGDTFSRWKASRAAEMIESVSDRRKSFVGSVV